MKDQNPIGFKSELQSKKGERIEVSAQVVVFNQSDTTIIFSPALEIYRYGKSLEEAKSSIQVSLEEFINYTTNKGTFEGELKRLGWTFKKRRKKYVVPSFSKMLRKNEKLIEILDNNSAQINQQEFALPY